MIDRPATRSFPRRLFAFLRKSITPVLLLVLLFASAVAHAAVPLLDTYYSPCNKKRAIRKSTRYIILHTTEGPAKGSGQKLKRYGEAHYMIDEAGRIYRVIDRRRIAYHCGRSMWDGRTNLDRYSIGIEMVGYHNKNLTYKQKVALANLLKELKRIYQTPDYRILTHSMVAYGKPNQWHKRNHRGRKRCGMLMATASVRSSFGVKSRPSYDPDVRAGRLTVADKELQRVLYSGPSVIEEKKVVASFDAKNQGNVITSRRSAWDIARDAYKSSSTIYLFPNGKRKRGNEITNWKAMPRGTKVILDENTRENEETGDDETTPVHSPQPSAPPRPAEPPAAPGQKTLVKATATAASPKTTTFVTPELASKIAGAGWDAEDTLYVIPSGKLLRGTEIDARTIVLLTADTKVLKGYLAGGPITAKLPAFNICGPAWNRADTFYLLPTGKLVAGDKISASRIPAGTRVLFKK